MTEFQVLLTDYPWPDAELERQLLASQGARLIAAPSGDEPTLMAWAKEADAIMTCWAKVTARVIQSAARCRIVSRMGIGLDNIDVAECTARNIPVTNVPDYCLHEVAEHTIALVLALGRKIAWYHAATKAGKYELQAGPPLKRLAGQTLGIVGLGNIGRAVADRAVALGFTVLAATRGPKPHPGVTLCSRDELLAHSDYVSLHVPLGPDTRHLVGPRELGLMRPGSYLINTARGGLVDHAALAAALADGRLAGAALDVQDPEPPDLRQPPYNDPRVIVTPHAAFVSEQSLADLRRRATLQVLDRLHGRQPPNIVNLSPS